MRRTTPWMTRLVLVGAGHAHVQVLRRLAMEPMEGVAPLLVVDRASAIYSGMVPGFVAGEYSERDLTIDVHPLARRAGVRVVYAAAESIDPERRLVHVEGRPPVRYDLCSLNVGSTVAGLDVPGVREHALATRPIGRFVEALEQRVERLQATSKIAVVVVGGGAAGVELAFTLAHRLGDRLGGMTVVESGDHLLGPGSAAREKVRAAAEARGLTILTGARVARLEPGVVHLVGRESLPCDLVVWAAGAAPPDLIAASPGLPTGPRGYLATRATLQVEGFDDLFAVGDCAVQTGHPWVPRAGVYAVRSGPVLADNLEAAVRGWPLRPYVPQRSFLSLLNLGGGEAIGTKWGRAIQAPAVWRLKDRIDRRFMRRFQVLDADALPAADHPPMDPALGGQMICGGCAAKVGQSALAGALATLPASATTGPDVVMGLDERDDAMAVRTPGGELVVSNLDAFRPFTDDPWLAGRVAALNAVSDLQAKGVSPRHAVALVALPDAPESIGTEDADARHAALLQEVMAGALAALAPLGVTLLGGHTTTSPELLVGFEVKGYAQDGQSLRPISGLRPGQALVLTRAIGTGVLLHADALGLVPGAWFTAAIASMLRSNAVASDVAARFEVGACTDVTGFGLAGHLAEMTRASGVCAELWLDRVPLLDGACSLLARGHRSTSHASNVAVLRAARIAPGLEHSPELAALADPQTSGGLLFAVDAEVADEVVDALRVAGEAAAAVVGMVTPSDPDGAVLRIARARASTAS